MPDPSKEYAPCRHCGKPMESHPGDVYCPLPAERPLSSLTIRIDYVGGPSEWGDADVEGVLLDPNGDVLWGHFSSSRQWLVADLTSNFGRAADLSARYPGGYVVRLDGEVVARVVA